MDNVEERLTVFIDDEALNWPQIIVERKDRVGISKIKVDLPKPYNEKAKKKMKPADQRVEFLNIVSPFS